MCSFLMPPPEDGFHILKEAPAGSARREALLAAALAAAPALVPQDAFALASDIDPFPYKKAAI